MRQSREGEDGCRFQAGAAFGKSLVFDRSPTSACEKHTTRCFCFASRRGVWLHLNEARSRFYCIAANPPRSANRFLVQQDSAMMIAHAVGPIESRVPAPRVAIRRMVHPLVGAACWNNVSIPAVPTVCAVSTVKADRSVPNVIRRASTNADADTSRPHKNTDACPSMIGLGSTR